METEVERLVRLLGLRPHREAGFFKPYFRSARVLELPEGTRSASSSILLMMPAGSFGSFHRMKTSDEYWHHYGGGPVDLHVLEANGTHHIERLGSNLEAGERPQIVVPAGVLQAAAPASERHALLSCLVVPGFDIADVETPSRGTLLERFPQHAELVRKLTHPDQC